ncbi:MAG: TonB-dependent receptor [Sphingobacteriia bacterium]|nr:MAG: TonB-dependent receptor [Sphingobacteriia bacterium]
MSKKILTLWALVASGLLQAQSKTDTTVLDPVTVTANKMAQRASTTGKVITIIDKATLEKNQGRSVAALLNETAGITLNGALNNAGTNQTVFMRGAASGRTLVLIDGIPVNDASQIGNEFDLNFLSVNDVERIEICRGAQSSIYGSDAVAGVINLITEKQEPNKKIGGKASLTAGNYGTYRQQAQLYGKVGKLQYSLRHAGLQSDGFSTATDTLGNRHYDKDKFRGISQAARLQFALTSALTLKAYVMRNTYQAGLDERIFTDDKQLNLDHQLLNTGGGFQYKHSRFQLTGNYQFSQTFNRDSADKTAFSYFVRNSFFSKGQFAELYANVPLTKTLKLLAGYEYRYNSMNSRYFAVSSFGPFTTQFRDTSVWSFYHAISGHIGASKFWLCPLAMANPKRI